MEILVDERVCWSLVEFDGGVPHVSHYLDLTIGLVGCVALQNGAIKAFQSPVRYNFEANFHGPMEYTVGDLSLIAHLIG